MMYLKSPDTWIATMLDGSCIIHKDYIIQAINEHPSELMTLSWKQNTNHKFTLDFIQGFMTKNCKTISWPKKLPYKHDKVTIKAGKRWEISPPSPSSKLNCVFLGVEVDCGGYTNTMLLKIFEDNSWEWETVSSVSNLDAQCVTDVDYWKIYYSDATIITPSQMNWEDAPTDGVIVVLLFFKSPHPAAPRARLHGYDYYWKNGNVFGFSRSKPEYAQGSIKKGVWVSDEIWKWVNLTSRKDFVVDGYANPSPEW